MYVRAGMWHATSLANDHARSLVEWRRQQLGERAAGDPRDVGEIQLDGLGDAVGEDLVELGAKRI